MSTEAPTLSALDTNMNFTPARKRLSKSPFAHIVVYRSPWPGGHHSRLGFAGHEIGLWVVAQILGTILWRKSIGPPDPRDGYLFRYRRLSFRVPKLFMR